MIKKISLILILVMFNILSSAYALEESNIYAYVISAQNSVDVNGDFSLKVVESGIRTKNTLEFQSNTETTNYTLQNSEIKTLKLSDVVTINFKEQNEIFEINYKEQNKEDIIPNDITKKLISYSLDISGKVCKITIHEIPSPYSYYRYNFNAKLFSFGGPTVFEAFMVKENTPIICLPFSSDPVDADYLLSVSLYDGSNGIKVYPINLNDDTQVPEVVILGADMDASKPENISIYQQISIIKNIKKSTYIQEGSEEEKYIYELTLLTGNKEETIQSGDYMDTSYISYLKEGDLVQYALGRDGKLSNILQVARITLPVEEGYYPNDSFMGHVHNIRYNRLSVIYNEMVDEVTFDLGENYDLRVCNLLKEGGPVIYQYEISTGNITAATTNDLKSFTSVGESASKVLCKVYYNEITAMVIFKEQIDPVLTTKISYNALDQAEQPVISNIAAGTIQAKAEFTNVDKLSSSTKLVTCLYEKGNNKLISIKIADTTQLVTNQTDVGSGYILNEVVVPLDYDNYYIKSYIWSDLNTLNQICLPGLLQ